METHPLLCWSARGRPALWDLCWEESLLETASLGSPCFFTYAWRGPVLVLGYGQRDLCAIDLAFCREAGIPVLRRCTGGSGVLHQGDLSFALALPSAHPWAQGIRGLYDGLVEAVRGTLEEFGVAASRHAVSGGLPAKPSHICFEDRGTETLLCGGGKVLGCAQARRRSSVLVHGTLLFHLDEGLQARVFKVTPSRIGQAMGTVPIRPGLGPDAFAGRLGRLLAERLDARPLQERPPPPPSAECLRRADDPFWCPVPDPLAAAPATRRA